MKEVGNVFVGKNESVAVVPVREVQEGAGRLREGPVMIAQRPVIEVAEAELHDLADQAWDAIMQANDPPTIFRRGGALVYVGQGDDYRATITTHSVSTLSDLMSRTAMWRKTDAKGNAGPVYPPERVAKIVLEWDPARYGELPRLERVARCPFFSIAPGKSVWDLDGDEPDHGVQLVTESGYSPDSGVWLDLDPEFATLAPVTGSDHDMHEASQLLNMLIDDFPFVTDAHKANAGSLMLLPYLRELIDGDLPLYLVTAPTPGTGKGLLADVCLIPSQGEHGVARVSGRGDSNEWGKKILALLLEGPSVVMLDNLREGMTLDSPELAGVLTSGGWWTDRILGVSKVAKVRVRNVWVATGNNIEVSKENGRRICRVVLDAGVERPENRQGFQIPNLRKFVIQHRAEIVWACLTVIQSWLNGHTVEDDIYRPWLTQSGARKASFDEWARVMGGLLAHAGTEHFLEDVIESPEDNELGLFFEAIEMQVAVSGPLSAKQLGEYCSSYGSALNEALPDVLQVPHIQLQSKLNYWLRKHRNRVANGRKLVKDDATRRWSVVRPT